MFEHDIEETPIRRFICSCIRSIIRFVPVFDQLYALKLPWIPWS